MRYAITGGCLLVLGALAIPSGLLSASDALDLWDRVWPILLFVTAITVVTELAAEAGLFGLIAERTAVWGRGRAWLLWMLVVVIASLSTIFLSLDTTAVLLTPVVIVLARHVGLDPLPFALTTVWLANTASMLLPVSNLTNLLAQDPLGNPTPVQFAALTWAPALVAIVIPAVLIFVVFRKSLLRSYAPDATQPVDDRVLAIASGIVVAALLPALVSGVAVWIPAVAAACILIVFFAVRRRSVLRFRLLPWQIVLFAAGLFFFIAAAQGAGLDRALGVLAGGTGSGGTGSGGTGSGGTGSGGILGLLRVAGVGGLGANLVNNLPAYVALEPIAHTAPRIIALLIGVNVGPLITPWASLATLLWFERLDTLHVRMPKRRFVTLGLVVAPLTVAAATAALWLAG